MPRPDLFVRPAPFYRKGAALTDVDSSPHRAPGARGRAPPWSPVRDRTVSFTVRNTGRDRWVTPSGTVPVHVGMSSRDIRLAETISVR